MALYTRHGSQTSSVKWAFRLFPAVAYGCAVVGGLRPEDFSVVAFDVCNHTVHATIVNLAMRHQFNKVPPLYSSTL